MRGTRWERWACVAAAALLAACGDAGWHAPALGRGVLAERRYDSLTYQLTVSAADLEMNRAMSRARATADALRHPREGKSYLVKVRLGGQEQGEHVWADGVRYENGWVVGRLTEDAVDFPSWSRGDEVRVRPGELSDWATVENGRVCGSFTTRVIAAQMTPEQRAAWFRGMEFDHFPPGDTVCDEGGRP
jgi:uncharacterized protein YegJ (DUF2314 family)